MLDQNTDRMWYVIGAIIVGAALIFIMNGVFPTLFANIGNTFEDRVGETTEMTDGIRPHIRPNNRLNPDDFEWVYSKAKSYDSVTDTYEVDLYARTDDYISGIGIFKHHINVPYGKTLTFNYDIYIPLGIEGLELVTDINNVPVGDVVIPWSGNDNDAVSKRIHGGNAYVEGSVYYQPLIAGSWNNVHFSYTNLHSGNVDQVALTDNTYSGVLNHTGNTVKVKIRNLSARVH